jgi:hypothetical protein
LIIVIVSKLFRVLAYRTHDRFDLVQVKAFTGGGFKLGSESQPSVAVGLPAAPPSAEPRKFILKMWQVFVVVLSN